MSDKNKIGWNFDNCIQISKIFIYEISPVPVKHPELKFLIRIS